MTYRAGLRQSHCAFFLLGQLLIFCEKMLFVDMGVSFGKLVINGGLENKKAVAKWAQRYEVKRVVVSAYHPQANKMIECGHKPIVDALLKISDGSSTNWVQNLPAILWVDRSTVHTLTGFTPYYISYGIKLVLSIELEIPTWRILP